MKLEQQCISFLERDDESSSYHLYLAYSLHTPYKSFFFQVQALSEKLLLNGCVPFSCNAQRSTARLRKL